MNEVYVKLTVGDLKEVLNNHSDDTQVYVKTWSSEPKSEIEIIEKGNYIILKGV